MSSSQAIYSTSLSVNEDVSSLGDARGYLPICRKIELIGFVWKYFFPIIVCIRDIFCGVAILTKR